MPQRPKNKIMTMGKEKEADSKNENVGPSTLLQLLERGKKKSYQVEYYYDSAIAGQGL